MSDAMDDRAVELRERLGIPPLGGAPAGHRADQDGWYVTRRGARFIGLVRNYPAPDGRMLLARRLRDKLAADPRLGVHVSNSWDAMDAAGHHVDDVALALAVAMREAETNITLSTGHACSYHHGGLDNVWATRRLLPLPSAVRRRLSPAYDTALRLDGRPVHRNEAGRVIEPAEIRGRDRLVLYSAMVLRAESMLRGQMRNVFSEGWRDRFEGMTTDQRRAWTQLSFGRGGGGGLRRALEAVRDAGTAMQGIFTDEALVERMDSVKRARVTAGDAALIERFVLPVPALGAVPSTEEARP